MLRASLLVLVSAVHAQTPTRTLGGLTPRAPRSSALLSTQDMFVFWCNAEREKSLLCQQHVRTAKLGALQKQILSVSSTDTAKKAALITQRTALINEGKANPIASTRKEYLDMKEAYCASEPAKSKAVLCAHPTSRYQSLQTTRSAPSAITWYCAIPANIESGECKRNLVSAKLRGLSLQPGSASLEARKKLIEELKAHPFNYAAMQAIQADFCKVNKHNDDYSCLRLKQTQAQAAMQTWHCARPTSTESAWCKRDQLLKKLRVLSLTASAVGNGKAPPPSPERTALLEELRAISAASRRSVGGTAYSSISKELSDAKSAYCLLSSNTGSAYCKPPVTKSLSGAIPRLTGR